MTRRTFHKELEGLAQRLFALGQLCVVMVDDAVQGLLHGDVGLAEQVIRRNGAVDASDLEIEAVIVSESLNTASGNP